MAVNQVNKINGLTNVIRVISEEQFRDKLHKLNDIYDFVTYGDVEPKYQENHHDPYQGGKNRIRFQEISDASAKHKEQRERIDRAVQELELRR